MAKPRKTREQGARPDELVTMTVKVERQLRDRFSKECRINEQTMAQALRLYMKKYVASKGQIDLFQ